MRCSACLVSVQVSHAYVAMGNIHALKNLIFVDLSVPFHNLFSCFSFWRAIDSRLHSYILHFESYTITILNCDFCPWPCAGKSGTQGLGQSYLMTQSTCNLAYCEYGFWTHFSIDRHWISDVRNSQIAFTFLEHNLIRIWRKLYGSLSHKVGSVILSWRLALKSGP